MTVFDASVFVDALLVEGLAGEDAREALRDQSVLAVPAVFSAEAVSAVRRLLGQSKISDERARYALDAIVTVRSVSYPFVPFVERVWQLRTTMTVYDAWYVALAEALGTSLVTADARLSRAGGPRCPVLEVGPFVASRR